MKAKATTRILPVQTTKLSRIVNRVRRNRERLVVGKGDEPQVVVMSIEEYLKNFVKPLPSLEALQQEAKAKGFDRMSMREINREISRYRRERRRKPGND